MDPPWHMDIPLPEMLWDSPHATLRAECTVSAICPSSPSGIPVGKQAGVVTRGIVRPSSKSQGTEIFTGTN